MDFVMLCIFDAIEHAAGSVYIEPKAGIENWLYMVFSFSILKTGPLDGRMPIHFDNSTVVVLCERYTGGVFFNNHLVH